ncbi:MAG TPA: FemAB family PEP-CTERM system-associated protein [Syntrophorhabdaceae bacterium]|nr:FemAB family PEP-CTERM system-associated protein [Syntrophorhabdaceae bacterium]HOD75178.1 FemAB family PEP-CTERM system-associated protein [Syntrophorhabdaceae bacterium]
MTVHFYNESDRDDWDRYVVDHNSASCYHLTGWKDVIEESFGHRTFYLLSRDEAGAIDGILPLVHLNSLLFGNFAVSLPFFNYGGICADSDGIRDGLFEEAARFARTRGMAHLELRHSEDLLPGVPVKTSKVSMRLALPGTKEELNASFPSKLRSQVRRAVKEGMVARMGGQEELGSFHSVFSRNMRDLGTPVYSRRFFRAILERFPDAARICTVYTREGMPVASGMIVGFRDTLEIPWASSLKDFNRYGPNMLLYATVLGFACDAGYRVFDFGRSTPDEGTYRFKEQWGAKPAQLYWHYWLRNGRPMPEINPRNPKYGLAIRIWQHLPLGLTRLIGPPLVKNLP